MRYVYLHGALNLATTVFPVSQSCISFSCWRKIQKFCYRL